MAPGRSIIRSPTPGPALFADLQITDAKGQPIEGVEVDVWHSSPEGFYEQQDPKQAPMNLRGQFTTDKDGRFDLELLDAKHDAWEYSVRVSSSQHVSGTYTLDEQIRMDRFLRAILLPR